MSTEYFFRKFNPLQLSFKNIFNIINTFCSFQLLSNIFCSFQPLSNIFGSFQPLSNALLKGWKLQKILVILKNVLNESFRRIKFSKKKTTQRKHIFIYLRSKARHLRSGATRLQRFAFLKFYNALTWECTQHFSQNAKNSEL